MSSPESVVEVGLPGIEKDSGDELITRFKELRAQWTSSMEDDGDDSSDEEEVSCSLSKYDLSSVSDHLPMLVQAIALSLYWSDEVNKIYYKKKRELLSGNKLILSGEDIAFIAEKISEEAINFLFSSDGLPQFFKKYSRLVLKNFKENHEKEFREFTESISDIFKKNPRLFLKHSSKSIHEFNENFYPEFYEPLYKIFKSSQAFVDRFRFIYDEEFQFLIAECSDLPDQWECIKKEARIFLRKIDVITEAGYQLIFIKHIKSIKQDDSSKFQKFEMAIYELLKKRSYRSNKTVDKFLEDNQEHLTDIYFQQLFGSLEKQGMLTSEKGKTRSEQQKIYRISQEIPFPKDCLFIELETTFVGHLRDKLSYQNFSKLCKNFNKYIFESLPPSKPKLERTILPENFHFISKTRLDLVLFSRLCNRSQARNIRQKTEEVDSSKRSMSGKVFRSVQFENAKSMALEIQSISCNGKRSEQVVNLGTYDDIYQELRQLQESFRITDKDIAEYIRLILENKPITFSPSVSPLKVRTVHRLLVNVTYLLFITEPVRNPSCWITHQMLLDLIIAGHLTWEKAIKEEMPMSIKDAAVSARFLIRSFKDRMPRYYSYPGDSDKPKSWKEIQGRENALIKKWMEKIANQPERKPRVIILDAVNKWYGMKMEFSQSGVGSSFLTFYKCIAKYRKKVTFCDDKTKQEQRTLETLNVSGQGNNCGLFALVLGINVALADHPELRAGVRHSKFFETVSRDSLQRETPATAEIGQQLRGILEQALLGDKTYKEQRLNSFISCCLDFVENRPTPLDMSGFKSSNKVIMEELNGAWISLKTSLSLEIRQTTEAFYRACLEKNIAQPSFATDLEVLRKTLSALVLSQDLKAIDELLEQYSQDESDPLRGFIRARQLFRTAWLNVTTGAGLDRNRLSERIEHWFGEKAMAVLRVKGFTNGPSGSNSLFLCALSEKSNFTAKGELITISSPEELTSSMASLFIKCHVKEQWEAIYKRYCEYLKTTTELLTADELGCLSQYCGVQLKIQFNDDRAPYHTYQERNPAALHVTLCNRSLNHWMVVVEEPVQALAAAQAASSAGDSEGEEGALMFFGPGRALDLPLQPPVLTPPQAARFQRRLE